MFDVQYYYISLSLFPTLDQWDLGEEFGVILAKNIQKSCSHFRRKMSYKRGLLKHFHKPKVS